VPDLSGETVAAAGHDLTSAGLTLGTQTPANSKTVPEGHIIDQSPESGTQVDKGHAIDVTVSSGVKQVAVPNVVGLSLDEASQTLKDAGLKLGDTNAKPSSKDEKEVLKVDPPVGEQVAEGSTVDVTYASGNNKVPDVTGDTVDQAQAELENAGFQLGNQKSQESTTQDPGTVISQSVAGGQTARLGSNINIVVATAPATPTETPIPTDTTTTPPPSG
jgi:serine/threonine-protein kinase